MIFSCLTVSLRWCPHEPRPPCRGPPHSSWQLVTLPMPRHGELTTISSLCWGFLKSWDWKKHHSWFNTELTNVGIAIRNHQFLMVCTCLYHPFMVIMGMVYVCYTNIKLIYVMIMTDYELDLWYNQFRKLPNGRHIFLSNHLRTPESGVACLHSCAPLG